MRACAGLTLLTFAACATAEPFWREYDASSGLFPEELGWERHAYYGGDQRSFANGCLVLDGLAPEGPSDFYRMDAAIALAPGEQFVMQWRMRVDGVIGPYRDPGVNFTVLGQALLTLSYTESTIYSPAEAGTVATFEPGLFHDYLLTSTDLDTYTLEIDGELAHTGFLGASGWESGVQWGDYTRPVSSMSTWDSFAFGVVPEPTSATIAASSALFLRRRSREAEHETFG